MATINTPEDAGGPPVRRSPFAPVIDHAPLPIVEVQGAGHAISDVNAAFCRLLGRPRSALVGALFADVVPGGAECVPVLDRVYQTGEPVRIEQPVEDALQTSQWLYAMWPARDEQQRPVGVIIQMTRAENFRQNAAAINEALLIAGLRQHELTAAAVTLNAELTREIAERKLAEAGLHDANRRLSQQAGELERRVAERTEKLGQTLSELEEFSYSVVHDLRGPLRGMEGFASILLTDHAAGMEPVARRHLERIATSAARMNRLIQEVLNYTRVLRSEAVLTAVNLDDLVRELVALHPEWARPSAEIEIAGVLPAVLGHVGLLTQCISNLLSNAVKFVAPGVVPCVRISATPAGEFVRLAFENNGIGIAAKDHEQVFRMFVRVHSPERAEGTGMGLTIARKAVERMGGAIDFAPRAAGGTCFWLDLVPAPRAPASGNPPPCEPAG